MRALLTLYLDQALPLFRHRPRPASTAAITALVYLTPLVGGLIADHFLGSKRSVKFGALIDGLGYLHARASAAQPAKPYATIDGQRYEVVRSSDFGRPTSARAKHATSSTTARQLLIQRQ